MGRIRSTGGRLLWASPLAPLVWGREPGFVIVGTGRSGTGYISRLLNEVGIVTGHESWWRLGGRPPQRMKLEGDASWPATFQLDSYTGRVFHQVRDPIKVMNSHYWDIKSGHKRGEMVMRYRSEWIDLTGQVEVDVMRICVAWLREAERLREWWWRLEDIDAGLITEIARHIGHEITEETANRAIEAVSRSTNAHVSEYPPINWDDLPDGELKAEAMEIAERYGYV